MKTKSHYMFSIAFIFTYLTSCASMFWPDEQKYENVYNGMTILEFKKLHPKAINEFMDSSSTVFSITFGDTQTKMARSIEDLKYKKFYYFNLNKLVKVDKGERSLDYKIKIE